MFAVIFELEGQLDCSLYATETEAKAEAARLSEKYAAERANYSASVAVQGGVQLPPSIRQTVAAATGGTPTASASICPHCGRDNTGYEGQPCSDDCPQYWEARGIEHPEHPTAEPAAPIGEAVGKVAMALWRAKAAKEIAARKAPKKLQPVLDGIKWAAFSIACELRGLDPEFDRAGFMAAAGYPGEF